MPGFYLNNEAMWRASCSKTPKEDDSPSKTTGYIKGEITLETLKGQEKELSQRLSSVRHEIREEKLRLYKEEYGIFVGCVVKDKEGKIFQVTSIEITSFNKPWAKGHPKKKDGLFGTSVRNVYSDWEVI